MNKDVYNLIGLIFQMSILIIFIITIVQICFFEKQITNEILYNSIFAAMLYIGFEIKKLKND